jgi:2-amino-4-hydroxy-6-hydroxymethyldihydropteridine diphosphokinase
MERHIAYIGAGSNIGDKRLNCQKGIDILAKSDNSVLKGQSRFYQTEPVDYKDQDWFINVVVKIETTLDPFALLNELKSIERDVGREDGTIRYGPRILDLDILMYDDLITNSNGLVVPHPRMHKRRFVLKPICDIAPRIVHPVLKKDMQYLLDLLDEKEQRIVEHTCDY